MKDKWVSGFKGLAHQRDAQVGFFSQILVHEAQVDKNFIIISGADKKFGGTSWVYQVLQEQKTDYDKC